MMRPMDGFIATDGSGDQCWSLGTGILALNGDNLSQQEAAVVLNSIVFGDLQ